MSSVFHYTDARGLQGIVRSEVLFATHYRFLNDLAEAQVIKDLILPIFEAEVAEITPKLVERGWLKKEFYEQHGLSGHRLQAEKHYSALIRSIDNVTPFFVLSFCKHPDGSEAFGHGLLSQWRGYAEGGGFAIEFDEQQLDQMMKEETDSYAYASMKSDLVNYDKFDQVFDSMPYRGLAGEMIRGLFEKHFDVSDVTGRANVDAVIPHYIHVAPFIKHWGFREEQEYRIVAAPIRAHDIPEEIKKGAKQVKFRVRDNLIVPYIELFDATRLAFPIKSIIVGPHPRQEKQEEAARMLLYSEAIDAEVRCSAIPLRN